MCAPTNQLRTQTGFTLVELMVVVAIIGVLASLASVMIRTTPSVAAVSENMAARLAETSRRAIAGGPVRADVLGAEFGQWGNARALLSFERTSYSVQLREEDPDSATSDLFIMRETQLPQDIEIADVELGLTATEPGSNPDLSVLFPVDLLCDPNGGCEPATIYLRDQDSVRFRIVVLSLNGTPLILEGW